MKFLIERENSSRTPSPRQQVKKTGKKQKKVVSDHTPRRISTRLFAPDLRSPRSIIDIIRKMWKGHRTKLEKQPTCPICRVPFSKIGLTMWFVFFSF